MANILNDSEILKILQNSEGSKAFSVVNWTLTEKGGALLGFLGGYFSLKIEAVIDGQPATKIYFVKTLPASAQQSEFMDGMNLFQKEADIYSKILASMPNHKTSKWTPKPYYCRKDILVLEDLTLENFQLMPPRQQFTKSHVQLVLKCLATLHANSFYLEKSVLKKPLNEVHEDIFFEVSITETNEWFTCGVRAIKTIAMSRTRFSKDPQHVKWLEDNFDNVISKIYAMKDNCPERFTKIFCHRDIWRNNLMFKFGKNEKNEDDFRNPLECALIDYQIATYQPPGVDVAMTLLMLQQRKEREMDFDENLKYYFEQLTDSLKVLGLDVADILSFSELLETFEHFKVIAATLKCIFLQMTHLPEGEIEKFHSNDDDYRQFILIDRGDTLVKYIDTDDFFKSWMVEAVEELIELLMSDKNDLNNV
ncbi:uncharacterized protein LOC134836872 [Culicoides brevitarsis]|uniref:uncharacterized protein LOC134836872 n=1 Tax=Culicoides brevitarsis TaxID=469753 RepID=UPI00307B92C4